MYPGTHAEQRPDHPAIVMGRSGEVVTYAELEERSNRLARHWRSIGLREGDHVAVFAENHPRYMEVVWAGLRSGLYVTAINSFLTAPELAYILNDCEARAFVTSRARAEIASRLQEDDAIPGVQDRLMMDGTVPGFQSYEDALAASSGERLEKETLGTTMLYSSGTTGRPKGIMRPLLSIHPSEFPNPKPYGPLYGYDRDMIYLSPAPIYHAAPLAFVNATLAWGGSVVMMEKFDAATALALIERHSVTHSQWVPTMFSRLLKLPAEVRERYDLSSHVCAIHAAAPCPVPVKREMIEWWGPILHEYYAGSEGNGSTGITSEEWLEKPGSVGRIRAGALHIVDENGNDLPPGEEGAVYFSGAGLPFEYHNAPEKTAESRLDGGRTTLGDVGYVDEDGYLFLTDRKAYMIISGGVNIYPREVEDRLITHPKVADVAVFGVPNEDFGEEVKAVVQTMPDVHQDENLADELLAWCREDLAAYKVPRSIDFVEELPRLPTGKLYKRILRDRYWGKNDSRIV
ncbi:MAG TPA: acyl-CoA synthetase [Deltaproteobacteria bacterium]|nr:acyl-CoA synthetase [Deltaproteobacteria bacterium]